MTEIARLRLLDSFKCLADACPDDCCHQWNAHVDKATLAKWQTISDTRQREHLLETIQESSQNPDELVLMRKEDNTCIHLDEHGLCEIQQNFSHDFLPQTCQEYPRVSVQKNIQNLATAHLSCPAIIDLLSRENSNRLIENHQVLNSQHGKDIISQLSGSMHLYLDNIYGIDSIYLGLKVYALSTVIAEIMQLAAEDTLSTDILNRQYRPSSAEIRERWQIWQGQSHAREFEQQKAEIKKFLQILDTGLLAKYKQPLQDRFKIEIPSLSFSGFVKWREQAQITKYEAFFEKYLMVKFMNNGFPWNPVQNNHTATFLDCVFPLILCHHIITAYHHANILVDLDLLKKITYTIEKLNAHNFDNFRLISTKPELLDIRKYNLFFTLLV